MDANGLLLKSDPLSIFVAIFIVFFSVLTLCYSLGFMKGRKGLIRYYLYLLLTAVTALATVFADNLILFLACWGVLGFLLYLLIGFGEKERTPATARKAFIIVGGTDALMLLGLAFAWQLTNTFQMGSMHIALNSKLAVLAYLCFAAAAFAKAGAMPFHSWIPDTAEDAPTPVTAFLPASLDKLLGIYFLARLSLNVFQMNASMNTFLMMVGAFTIVAAVMMALVQHDLKRLLGYHAVSQVGYMVLGIGTGNPIGIAGGLFHMLNNAIYKSCLFLSAGAVEKKAGTTDLDKLGGLAKVMPVTFGTFLIAAFAISGVPPFNGFASKWMIYQGILETAGRGTYMWILWLIAAMFGSALTLASFMKLIHAVFLGQMFPKMKGVDGSKKEAGITLLVPAIVLAFFCIFFGIFAFPVPLKMFIIPSLGIDIGFLGTWNSSLATVLILLGILIGFVIYLLGTAAKPREVETFIGGEDLKQFEDMRISGTEFYTTIQEMGVFRPIYKLAEKRIFDPYEMCEKVVSGFYRFLSYLHNGVLPTYLAWCLLGMVALFYLILK